MIRYTKTAMALGIASLVSTGVMAGNSLEDTHTFRLGVASQDADITAQSTLDPLPPIEIDLIDDLGMDDSSESIYFNYRWRFTEKWSLSVAYQNLNLDGDGSAAKDFNFDGKDYTAGVAVETEFDIDTYLIDVGYSIVRNDKWEVFVGGGLHAFDFDTSITASLGLGDGEGGEDDIIVGETTRTSADFLAPLPNLRGGAAYMITPRWEVNGSIGWLSLEIDEIDGNYTYVDFGTEYRFTDRFGVGANYKYSKIDVTSTNSDGLDAIDVEFSGPSIYLTYGF